MSLGWSAAVLIFFVVARAQQRHSCYVCVSGRSVQEVSQLFPNDSLVSCRQTSQVKLCPEGYMGCLTESKGSEVTRTCTRPALEGCMPVNGVEYCYCREELCNVPPLQAANVDDEDMTEGSGLRESTTTTSIPTSPHHNNTKVSSDATLSSRPATYFFLSLLVVTPWR